MASGYLSSITSAITNLLSSSSAYFQQKHPEFVSDLKQLNRKSQRIQAVLQDAEKREIEDEFVKLWLTELKQVSAEAEDVLEEFMYEVQRAKVEQLQQIEVDHLMQRMRTIKESFFDISKDRKNLHLRAEDGRRRPDGSTKYPLPTGYKVDKSEVYGREVDKQKIIGWLVSDKSVSFDVLAIVGKGGIGKTTLAKIVYNDDDVSKFFDRKIWICVSLEFDAVKLVKEMIESITRRSCTFTQISLLQETLEEELEGKKVLIVLDDVWNVDRKSWETFKNSITGKHMVRIIATTRNQTDSEIVQTMEPYCLGYLPHNECWELFKHHAFRSRDLEQFSDLVKIGENIVKKCDGLPLAIKSLASLLQYTMDEESWIEVLDNRIWALKKENEIFEVLKLSYIHMPNYLKPCFLICSIFPKDHIFEKGHLARLWMALGYLQDCHGRIMEEIANEYFDELHRRSFLDVFIGNERFKMHDYIHNLANTISGNDRNEFWFDSSNCQKILDIRKAKALILGSGIDALPSPTNKLKHLRYLSAQSRLDQWLNDSLCHLYNLRLLDLCHFSEIKLPEEIGNLTNLLCLSLRHSYIENLPESISQLSNLEILDLYDCKGVQKLTHSIGELHNLRHLDLYNTSVHNLSFVISKLTNLERLYAVIFHEELRLLKDMVNLQGVLCIKSPSLLSTKDCEEANLKTKRKLDVLRLLWFEGEDLSSFQGKHQLCFTSNSIDILLNDDKATLESLKPSFNLRGLEIRGYGGLLFPTWTSNPRFINLIKIQLISCWNVSSPPTLGQLPCLVSLLMKDFVKVKSIGKEFGRNISNGSNTAAFPSLRRLYVWDMHQWEEWDGVEDGDLPQLQELIIKSCPRMRSIPTVIWGLKKLERLEFDCQ